MGAGGLVQPQVREDDLGQVAKLAHALGGERARHRVDDAERADPDAGPQRERQTRVEADAGLAAHHRVRGEARVARGVLHHERLVGQDRVSAERHRARGAVQIRAALGLEPLPVFLDERDQRDGDREQVARQTADGVEVRLFGGVHDRQRAQGGEPVGFVRCW